MGSLYAVSPDVAFREWRPRDAAREGIDWPAALDRVVSEPRLLRPVFQPIFDLRRGLVRGYELLTRFPEDVPAPPEVWFAAAARHGRAGELEANIVRTALEARARVLRGQFLAVNLTPHAVSEPEVQALLLQARRLDDLVLEITEQVAVIDYRSLEAALAPLRAAGAAIAVDDAGAGYSSLHQVMMLRPDYVKVDRAIVERLDGDDTRRSVVEVLGRLAAELGSLVVAEGVERLPEIDALLDLRVPLAQGYALARPAPSMPEVAERIATYVRERGPVAGEPGTVAALVERPPVLPRDAERDELARVFLTHPAVTHVPLVDGRGAVAAIVARDAFVQGDPPAEPSLRVLPSSRLSDVARRAAARSAAERFEPIACCDEQGRHLGLIRVDRLLHALAG